MKISCKVWPLPAVHPAFPDEKFNWGWLVNIKLFRKHCPPTKWFEAWIDSGSPWCLFHSSLCRPLGIKLETGIKDELKGIVECEPALVYFHKVSVIVGSEKFDTRAGFSSGLSVAGILGRHGFFDNFKVVFDPSEYPPTIEITRIPRA